MIGLGVISVDRQPLGPLPASRATAARSAGVPSGVASAAQTSADDALPQGQALGAADGAGRAFSAAGGADRFAAVVLREQAVGLLITPGTGFGFSGLLIGAYTSQRVIVRPDANLLLQAASFEADVFSVHITPVGSTGPAGPPAAPAAPIRSDRGTIGARAETAAPPPRTNQP